MTLFHILPRADYARALAAGTYAPPSLAREGFVHLSTDRQLLRTAAKWFARQDDLLVLSLRADRLRAEVRYEPVGDDAFPHLYGALNLDAIVEAVALPRDPDGAFVVPVEWRAWAPAFR